MERSSVSKGLRLALADTKNGTDNHPTAISKDADPSHLSGINSIMGAKVDNRIEVSNESVGKLDGLVRQIRNSGALSPVDFLLGLQNSLGSKNGYKNDMLVHRFVGVVRIDGQEYVVKTTMHEHKQAEYGNKQYAYDVTKIAVLNVGTSSTATGLTTATKGVLPLANVLNGFEKYIDKEKNLSFLFHQSAPIAATAANEGLSSSNRLSSASQPVQQEIDKQDLSSAAKVVEEFENPTVHGWESDDASYREVPQGELLDELRRASEEGRTVRVYRTMQVIDGKLYSPMAKKVAGEETSEIKFRWEAAEEHPELAKRGDGSQAMPNEDTFYIKIDKGLDKGTLTVAYNPYTHTSRTVLNDQFSSAFARPNPFMVTEVDLYEKTANGLSLPITTRARGTTDGIVDSKLRQFFDEARCEDKAYEEEDLYRTAYHEAAALRGSLVDVARAAGVEVVMDGTGQGVLDRVNERSSVSKGLRLALADTKNGTDNAPTAIDNNADPSIGSETNSITGANVDNRIEVSNDSVGNLDGLVRQIRNSGALSPVDFLLGLQKSLGSKNGYKNDMLVHRFVGVVRIDGQEYVVKTTMHEHRRNEQGNKQYAYDLTKIAVLNVETSSTANGLTTATKGVLPLANVLNGFEKSYDSGKKLLEESKKEDERLGEGGFEGGEGGQAATVGEGHQKRSSLRSSEVEGGEGGEQRSSRMSSLGVSEVDDAAYREVPQGELLDELRRASEEGRTVGVYRTMQVIDGKLYSPMAKKVAGEDTSEIKFRWEAAEEHPELANRGDGSRGMPNRDGFYISIDKGQGKGALTVAYNPYTHTSRTVLNDQFSSAFARPNPFMVTEVDLYEKTANGLSLPITTRARGTTDGIVDSKLRQFFDEARREDKAYEEEDLYRTAYHEAQPVMRMNAG